MEYVGTAAIVGCYLCVIGLYVWVFKTISELKDKMHEHLQKSSQHMDAGELVFKDVCDQKVRRFEDSINGVKEQLSEVKKTIGEEFKEVKDMIRQHGKS